MFTRPKPTMVQSDEGFSVEELGRTGFRYREPDLSVYVGGELLAGPTDFWIDGEWIIPDPGYESVTLDVATKRRIVENAKRAFEAVGYKIDVTWPGTVGQMQWTQAGHDLLAGRNKPDAET